MKNLLYTLGALLAMLCAACGKQDDVAGGVDGNPNFLQGQLVFPDGKTPADSLPVILYGTSAVNAKYALNGNASSLTALDTAYSDSNGFFLFEIHSDGEYRVDVLLGDSVLYTKAFSYTATSGLAMDNITVPLPDLDYVLLDDFENATDASSLASWFGDALAWTDLLRGTDRVSVAPATLRGDVLSARSDCAGQGACLHFTATPVIADAGTDQSLVYNMLRPYADETIALPTADSVTVLAKGAGTLIMGVWVQDSLLRWSDWHVEARTYTLTENWQTFSFPLRAQVFMVDGVEYSWSTTCLHKFIFGLQGEGELWLDDVKIYGITLLDLQ